VMLVICAFWVASCSPVARQLAVGLPLLSVPWRNRPYADRWTLVGGRSAQSRTAGQLRVSTPRAP